MIVYFSNFVLSKFRLKGLRRFIMYYEKNKIDI